MVKSEFWCLTQFRSYDPMKFAVLRFLLICTLLQFASIAIQNIDFLNLQTYFSELRSMDDGAIQICQLNLILKLQYLQAIIKFLILGFLRMHSYTYTMLYFTELLILFMLYKVKNYNITSFEIIFGQTTGPVAKPDQPLK